MLSRNEVLPESSSDGDYRGFERIKSDGVIVQQILSLAYVVDVPRVYLRDVASSCSRIDDSSVQFSRVIDDFPNEPYKIIKHIPVMIQQNAPRDFTASFREANIAMPGETLEESLANLATHILDVYELLRDQPKRKLARHPREQLATLRRFFVEKTDRADSNARRKHR